MPWSDYPQGATDNAKRALKHREEHDSDCGTPVGWRTASILANRETISHDRLPRIYSFLSRAKTYDQGDFFDADGKEICGSVMYAAWGGDVMHRWAEKTLKKETKSMESVEKRYLKDHIQKRVWDIDVEVRNEGAESDGTTIRGYAAVYNSDSEWMGGFYEQIERGAFDNVLGDDVRAYFNHDENLLLGRVSSGTLRIGADERGLFYEVDLPNTTYANDLAELMKRGDVNQSSFAFLIEKDRWEQRDGITYRIIEKVSRLLDVSPVAQPAYPDATSELKRDLETETKEEAKAASAEKVESEDVKTKEEDSDIYLYKSKILNL